VKIKSELTNEGISLSVNIGDKDDMPLEAQTDVDQQNPRKCYVYAHVDEAGKIFYIGTGVGRRAWSTDRHPIYERYIKTHLGGKFTVKILRDNLNPGDAAAIENRWIAKHSEGLVNWVNVGRHVDYAENERRQKLQNANRWAISIARTIEKSDLERAVAAYIKAIDDIATYAFIADESGLVAQLLAEETAEIGFRGELNALDRLTLCLIKLGRTAEAQSRMQKYFLTYRRDQDSKAAEGIRKRVEKALAKSAKLAA
jgi:hypothetical protein